MAPVNVTVKSRLPEFRTLRIERAPIEPDTTWEAFFGIQGIRNFNPRIHGLKSSKNTALGEDVIQQTSELFTRRFIYVEIVGIAQTADANRPTSRRRRISTAAPDPRARILRNLATLARPEARVRITRPPSPPIPFRVMSGGISGRPNGNATFGRISRVRRPSPPTSAAAAARGISARTSAIAGAGRNIPASAPAPPNGIPRPRVYAFEEDSLSTGAQAGSQEQDFDHLQDAASIASEDSEDTTVILRAGGTPNFSTLKNRVLSQISRVPNADFAQMLRELKNVVATDQKYRITRKMPMVAGMIFQAFNV